LIYVTVKGLLPVRGGVVEVVMIGAPAASGILEEEAQQMPIEAPPIT
jgi:hypothetical protein